MRTIEEGEDMAGDPRGPGGRDEGRTGAEQAARRAEGRTEQAARRAESAAARAEQDRNEALALTEVARDAAVGAARRAGRFSREFLATVMSVVGTALGVVVALAWNAALTNWFSKFNSEKSQTTALFVYALLVTLLGVIVIFLLGRAARRLNADAFEFKIEAKREEKR